MNVAQISATDVGVPQPGADQSETDGSDAPAMAVIDSSEKPAAKRTVTPWGS
jgi:hypothetical protein